uniref:ATP-binding protein n=1 Tax=Microbispora cellulosiformans TaxID=2614688 RepID=UPI00384C3972
MSIAFSARSVARTWSLRTHRRSSAGIRRVIDLLRNDLVIIDELGFASLDDTGAPLVFRFAAAYERRALGIGSHWPFDQWGPLPARAQHRRQRGRPRRRRDLNLATSGDAHPAVDTSACPALISHPPCAGATMRRTAREAVGKDEAREECACGIPRQGGTPAARDHDELRAAADAVRVPGRHAPLRDHSMDTDTARDTGCGPGVAGSSCIDQGIRRRSPSPVLGPPAARSRRESGWIYRESDEPIAPLLGLLPGERGWRWAAYAASPFLIVMICILAHLNSMGHPAPCSTRTRDLPGSWRNPAADLRKCSQDRFGYIPRLATGGGSRWRTTAHAITARSSRNPRSEANQAGWGSAP